MRGGWLAARRVPTRPVVRALGPNPPSAAIPTARRLTLPSRGCLQVGTFVDLPAPRPWELCFCALLSNAVLHLVPAAGLAAAAAAADGNGPELLDVSTASRSTLGGG